MIGRVLMLSLLVTFVVAFFVRPVSAQQAMYCFSDFATAEQKAAEHGEKLLWRGYNLVGIELWFFSGPKSYTIFVKTVDEQFCTSPTLIGVKRQKGLAT